MASGIAARLSLEDVRASVQRIQAEGERLVGRIRQDARTLVSQSPRSLDDVRKRATEAVRDLDAQRAKIRALVVDRLTELADRVVKVTRVASADQVSDLDRRVAELERRLESLSKNQHQAA